MENKKYLDFFLDNPSGWKTVEKKLKNYDELLVYKILEYCETEKLSLLSFKNKIWHFIYEVKNIPKCQYCNEELKFGRSIREGYNKYCSVTCCNKSEKHITDSNETSIMKYGGIGMSSKKISDKVKKTNLKKYGVENFFEKKEFIKRKFF